MHKMFIGVASTVAMIVASVGGNVLGVHTYVFISVFSLYDDGIHTKFMSQIVICVLAFTLLGRP